MKYHALIIDDDEGMCEDIKNRLAAIEHTCEFVGDMTSACETLKNSNTLFNYIILDMEIPITYNSLPSIDYGLEMLKHIREKYSENIMPVIAITSHNDEDNELGAKLSGNAYYVLKPFKIDHGHDLVHIITHKVMNDIEKSWIISEDLGKEVLWKVISKSNTIYSYKINHNSKKNLIMRLLKDRISENIDITLSDLRIYFCWPDSKNPDVKNNIKQHMKVLREKLEIQYSFSGEFLTVYRPEK